MNSPHAFRLTPHDCDRRSDMYELGETRQIKITDMGEETIHYLKDPSGPDWLRYQRQIGAIDGDADKKTTEYAVNVYDTYVERVENYAFKGKPLMIEKPEDWKNFIPEHHKVRVALELINGRVLQKNSSRRSRGRPTRISNVPAGRNA